MLPLRATAEPSLACQAAIRRDIGGIDDRTRAVIRSLVKGESPWPLYLFGPAGLGKTSAALAVLDHCGKAKGEKYDDTPRGLRDWWYGYAEVRSLAGLRIQADKGNHSQFLSVPDKFSTWDAMLERWERLPVVVLDEVGVGKESGDFRLDVMLEVLNTRCNDPVRPMIVTGNLAPSQLPTVYDDRVASRILAGTVFQMTGKDRRVKR